MRSKIREAPEPEWAKDLVEHPGEWAVVERFGFDKTKANSMQARIVQRYWKWQDKYHGRWESSYREYENGYEVFARYVL